MIPNIMCFMHIEYIFQFPPPKSPENIWSILEGLELSMVLCQENYFGTVSLAGPLT